MPESQNIEYKTIWKDEYLKWICGFANAQGGSIFIGVNDKKEVVGVDDVKKLMEDIPNKVRDILGIVVDVNLYNEEGKDYLEIVVEPYPYPVSYKGQYHYRSGSTKQELKDLLWHELHKEGYKKVVEISHLPINIKHIERHTDPSQPADDDTEEHTIYLNEVDEDWDLSQYAQYVAKSMDFENLKALDDRRKELLKVSPYVATYASLPPKLSTEQSLYESIAEDLPNYAREKIAESREIEGTLINNALGKNSAEVADEEIFDEADPAEKEKLSDDMTFEKESNETVENADAEKEENTRVDLKKEDILDDSDEEESTEEEFDEDSDEDEEEGFLDDSDEDEPDDDNGSGQKPRTSIPLDLSDF